MARYRVGSYAHYDLVRGVCRTQDVEISEGALSLDHVHAYLGVLTAESLAAYIRRQEGADPGDGGGIFRLFES